MKTTALFLLATAALGLTSCDKAKDAATEAAAKAEAAAAEATVRTREAAAKAEGAMPELKEKANAALDAVKEAGAGALEKGKEALDKGKELAGAAMDWTKQKLGIPEADGLLDGFKALFEEAKTAVNSGMTSEKSTALKAKWDELYAKSSDTIKTLAPEQQEKLKAILTTIKAKWDELMEKSKDGAVQ